MAMWGSDDVVVLNAHAMVSVIMDFVIREGTGGDLPPVMAVYFTMSFVDVTWAQLLAIVERNVVVGVILLLMLLLLLLLRGRLQVL